MGVSRTINIQFDMLLDKQDISTIVQNAQELGCYFYGQHPEKYAATLLSFNQIVDYYYKGYKMPKVGGALFAHKDSAHFIISIHQGQGNSSYCSMTLLPDYWKKIFADRQEDIDYARYIVLLLNITRNFPIFSLATIYE